jgi:hypothetical protein
MKMKKGFVLSACAAALAFAAGAPGAFASDLGRPGSVSYEEYSALPKIEPVTVEVGGTFAAAKIEYISFKNVEGTDRYAMTGITGKGKGSGVKTLVADYKKVRLEAKSLMARLCGKKRAVVESDLLSEDQFTTRFRCQ